MSVRPSRSRTLRSNGWWFTSDFSETCHSTRARRLFENSSEDARRLVDRAARAARVAAVVEAFRAALDGRAGLAPPAQRHRFGRREIVGPADRRARSRPEAPAS